MSLVIVGSVALDTIGTPRGKVVDALGGSAIYASLSASYFSPTYIVGVVGEDFPARGLELLKAHQIHLDGLETLPGKTFRWSGRYDNWSKAETLSTELNVFADFSPRLPDCCKCCRSLLLGNIHPRLQLQVLEQIESYDWVGCDTMNYWIDLCPDELTAVLKKVDIVFMNEDEIKSYTSREDIYTAAREVLKLGVACVVVKRGEYGSVAVLEDSLVFVPAYPVSDVTDPTGAGDCFAGGFMSCLAEGSQLDSRTIRRAILHGTVLAALNVSKFSVEGIINLQRDSITKMVDQLHSWTCG